MTQTNRNFGWNLGAAGKGLEFPEMFLAVYIFFVVVVLVMMM